MARTKSAETIKAEAEEAKAIEAGKVLVSNSKLINSDEFRKVQLFLAGTYKLAVMLDMDDSITADEANALKFVLDRINASVSMIRTEFDGNVRKLTPKNKRLFGKVTTFRADRKDSDKDSKNIVESKLSKFTIL